MRNERTKIIVTLSWSLQSTPLLDDLFALFCRRDRLWKNHTDPSVPLWSWYRSAGHHRGHSASTCGCYLAGGTSGRGKENSTWKTGGLSNCSCIFWNTCMISFIHLVPFWAVDFIYLFVSKKHNSNNSKGGLHSTIRGRDLPRNQAEVHDWWHAAQRGDRRPAAFTLHGCDPGRSSRAHRSHRRPLWSGQVRPAQTQRAE